MISHADRPVVMSDSDLRIAGELVEGGVPAA